MAAIITTAHRGWLPPGLVVEGLRLLHGSLVLKLEGGAAAMQLRLEEACALAAGNVPCRGGGRATGSC